MNTRGKETVHDRPGERLVCKKKKKILVHFQVTVFKKKKLQKILSVPLKAE